MRERHLPESIWAVAAVLLAACGDPAVTHPMQWTEVEPAPLGRFEPLGAEVGGRIFVFGGFLTADTVTSRVDVYDPDANSWTRLSDMPAPQTHAGVAVEGVLIHVVGGFLGFPSPSRRTHWVYDTRTDEWSERAELPIAMAGHVLARVGDSLHAIGGFDEQGRGAVDSHLRYALSTQTWATAPPNPHARDHLGGAVVNGKIYVVGGRHGWDEVFGHRGELQELDPATGQWAQKAELPAQRSEISYATIEAGGRLLTIGGSTPFVQPSNELWAYDPATDGWSLFDRMPGRRKGVVAARIGDRLIVTQGSPSSTDPVPTTWVACCLP